MLYSYRYYPVLELLSISQAKGLFPLNQYLLSPCNHYSTFWLCEFDYSMYFIKVKSYDTCSFVLISLSIMLSRFIHEIVLFRVPFLLRKKFLCMYNPHFTNSFICPSISRLTHPLSPLTSLSLPPICSVWCLRIRLHPPMKGLILSHSK